MPTMELSFEDTWLNMEKSDKPLISNVIADELTAQACSIFDYKENVKSQFYSWLKPNLPDLYKIGLIVGGSGSGKSTLLKQFGIESKNQWQNNKSILSHFDSVEDATEKMYAVGLSSVPTWVKPYQVLSNGEKFRVDLAKSLKSNAIIDEYTSVVDRNVAISASKTINSYINKTDINNVVFASCHRDIIPYLKPDWIIDLDAGMYVINPKECLRRPKMVVQIYEVKRSLWEYFMGHHYLTTSLHPFARCYIACMGDQIVSFASSIPFPNRYLKKAWREHRTVTLPDFQGLGIGVRLSDWLAEAHIKSGYRYFSRTAHPRMGEYRENHKNWQPTSNNKKIQKSNKNPNWSHWNFDDKRIAYSHEFIVM